MFENKAKDKILVNSIALFFSVCVGEREREREKFIYVYVYISAGELICVEDITILQASSSIAGHFIFLCDPCVLLLYSQLL